MNQIKCFVIYPPPPPQKKGKSNAPHLTQLYYVTVLVDSHYLSLIILPFERTIMFNWTVTFGPQENLIGVTIDVHMRNHRQCEIFHRPHTPC